MSYIKNWTYLIAKPKTQMKDTYSVVTTNQNQIEAKKESINRLFTAFWFRVPDYQRSYVWGKEQMEELIEDLTDALAENPDKEYFLGSIVLQKYQETDQDLAYNCYDLLDGQQRITTCLLYTSPSPRDATLSRMPSSA